MTFDPSGSLLFSETSIRGVRLENKIVLPAMATRLSGADGFVNGDIRDRCMPSAACPDGWNVYNNVCKALDERFHRVRCTLWRKHDLQAPEAPDGHAAPVWPEGASLSAREVDGRVRLEWTRAAEDAGGGTVYGYMVLRSEEDGPWVHVDSARGVARRFDDASALGGTRYRYRIVAYDLAGNRSQPLGPVDVRLVTVHA